MKKNIKVFHMGKILDKEISVIPLRYILAMMLIVFEIIAIVAIMVLLAIYVPYFYIAIYITQIVSLIGIVVSNDNPDYKAVWLFFLTMLPLVGLILYFNFSKRTLPKKYIKRYNYVKDSYKYNHDENFKELQQQDLMMFSQAKVLCDIAHVHLYKNTKIKYYSLGDFVYQDLLTELKNAKKFIFLEYFIIENGEFWGEILKILEEKANSGVEVKLIYDDIGCMNTLPGNYIKQLQKMKINAVLFSKLRGSADGEFNNRTHRKMTIIDGRVVFTGGINLADEYVNKAKRFGHWKDFAIKIEGMAINEFTKLFLTDFYTNNKKEKEINFENYYIANDVEETQGFVVPFGDGPKPIYMDGVGKTAIINLLNSAVKSVCITTPYLVADTEMMRAIENTAKRGVEVKLIVPHVADKKLIFGVTKSNYQILMKSGVKVYEYSPGFIHSKLYVADNTTAIVGTMNLDYRSLSHNFENGVWIYNHDVIQDVMNDFNETLKQSECMNDKKIKYGIVKKLINVFVRLFSPLL